MLSTEDAIEKALARFGEPDDVLEYEWADAEDRAEMNKGHHFDYQAQEWRDGHDHAHIWSALNFTRYGGGPLAFCGADLTTCQG